MRQGKNCTIWHPEKSVLLDCSIGDRCTIHALVWIGNNVHIGDDCKVQGMSFIPEGVIIGNRVFIGPNVTFCNDKYPPSDELLATIIEDDVSIGAGSVILPGITLEKGCRVGAGSVVTKNVRSGLVVAGVPAKELN